MQPHLDVVAALIHPAAHLAAHKRTGFVEIHLMACIHEVDSSGEAGEAGTNDRDPHKIWSTMATLCMSLHRVRARASVDHDFHPRYRAGPHRQRRQGHLDHRAGDAAAGQAVCSEQGDNQVLRVGVRSGGCSGMSYTMDFVPASDTLDDDETYEYVAANGQSFRVICDPKSLLYIYGMQLDFSTALIGGGFNFTNPNASQTCGCGSSFAV